MPHNPPWALRANPTHPPRGRFITAMRCQGPASWCTQTCARARLANKKKNDSDHRRWHSLPSIFLRFRAACNSTAASRGKQFSSFVGSPQRMVTRCVLGAAIVAGRCSSACAGCSGPAVTARFRSGLDILSDGPASLLGRSSSPVSGGRGTVPIAAYTAGEYSSAVGAFVWAMLDLH